MQLEQLKGLHEAKGTDDDGWRVLGLRKGEVTSPPTRLMKMIAVDLVFGPLAIAAIRALPIRLKSVEEACTLPGVGVKTAMKVRVLVLLFLVALLTAMFQIKEIMETGGLRRIGFENTEDIEIMRIFQGVYGVGA